MKVYNVESEIYLEDEVTPLTLLLSSVSSLDKAKEVVDENLVDDKEANSHNDVMYYVSCWELDGNQLKFSNEEVEKYDLESDEANYRMLLGKYKGEF